MMKSQGKKSEKKQVDFFDLLPAYVEYEYDEIEPSEIKDGPPLIIGLRKISSGNFELLNNK